VPNTTLHWQERYLDNFDYAERRTFRQRVFTYEGFWSKAPTAPILFYCGNEASVELYINATGLMWESGASMNALLVFAEHRYYGETLPLGSENDVGSWLA
jgi:lysosomal Pro-X carboxypeptidase